MPEGNFRASGTSDPSAARSFSACDKAMSETAVLNAPRVRRARKASVTARFQRSKHRRALEQVLANWEESQGEEPGLGDGPTSRRC